MRKIQIILLVILLLNACTISNNFENSILENKNDSIINDINNLTENDLESNNLEASNNEIKENLSLFEDNLENNEINSNTIEDILINDDLNESQLKKKWYPGHYLYATDNANHLGILDNHRNRIKNNPYFTGYHAQYWWHRLEPKKGEYDFSMIIEDLNKAQADGKKLTLMFYDRIFHKNRPFPVPNYLVEDPIYEGGVYMHDTNTLPKLWVPSLVDRQILLIEALAKEVDDHPALAAFLFQETALSARQEQEGFTEKKYHDSLIRLNQAASNSFKKTPVIHWTNFGLTPDLRDSFMKEIIEVQKGGFGTPDTYNNNNNGALSSAFGKYYEKYDGIAVKYASVESSSYQTEKNMEEVLNFGVDVLKLNFMAWSPKTWGEGYMIDDAILAINKQEGRINTKAPLNMR